MPISGTIPAFDISTSPADTPTVVTVTGLEADGQGTGPASDETLQAFMRRGVIALGISGALAVDPAGLQAFPGSEISGVMQFQRELAMRIADLEKPGHPNAPRLAFAQAELASGAEVQFGS